MPLKLTRDQADTLHALATYLAAAFTSFAAGVTSLGVDASPLAAPSAALLAALATFKPGKARVRDPINVALGDAREALVEVDGSLAILEETLRSSADLRAQDWREDATYQRESVEFLDEALEAAADVIAHVREGASDAVLIADCVRDLATVQDRAARVRAHARVQVALRTWPVPGAAVN